MLMYFRALNLVAHFLTRFHKNADICGVQKLLTYQEISAGGGRQSPRVNQYFILMLTLQLYLRQTDNVTKLDLKQFKYIH